MLRRVRDFGVAHAADFPAATLGSTLIGDVGATVSEIESTASTQTSKAGAARQKTESKSLARETLMDEMEAISLTARAIALEDPGLENKFRLPRNPSDQALLNSARAFLSDATPLAAEFTRREMATDFLSELQEAIQAFEQAITGRNHDREGQVTATASLDVVIGKGLKHVKQLNAVVRNKYRNNPAMLAAWTSASHVERHKGRRSSPELPPATPSNTPPTAP